MEESQGAGHLIYSSYLHQLSSSPPWKVALQHPIQKGPGRNRQTVTKFTVVNQVSAVAKSVLSVSSLAVSTLGLGYICCIRFCQ